MTVDNSAILCTSTTDGNDYAINIFYTNEPNITGDGTPSQCLTLAINVEQLLGCITTETAGYIQVIGYKDEAKQYYRTYIYAKLGYDETNNRLELYLFAKENYASNYSAGYVYFPKDIKFLFFCWCFYINAGAIGCKLAVSAGNTFGTTQDREEGIQTTGYTGTDKQYQSFLIKAGVYNRDNPGSFIVGSPFLHEANDSIKYESHPLHRDDITSSVKDCQAYSPTYKYCYQLKRGIDIPLSVVQGQLSSDLIYLNEQKMGDVDDEADEDGGVFSRFKWLRTGNFARSLGANIIAKLEAEEVGTKRDAAVVLDTIFHWIHERVLSDENLVDQLDELISRKT